VRVEEDEQVRVRADVANGGRRYSGLDLDGATIDADYALVEAGFTDPHIGRTGLIERMVVYTCRPNWPSAGREEVVRRLEESWVSRGAFGHEAHTISHDADSIALDFVTWWDSGAFYTGRIEVTLSLG
jgi:hypothetical protein